MSESHFLWPKSHALPALVAAPRYTSISVIEEKLRSLFSDGYPVLCSSGRAALALALIESGVTRSSLVGLFPYASHCVLDTVARVATPLSGSMAKSASLRVVYHQWGYVQEINLPKNTIEDCVDTLCVPGAALFPGGGRFEIWSLPKILGTSSGGVLWCRDEETATKIRAFRDAQKGGTFQWLLRLLARRYPRIYDYWQGAEGSGQVSRLQTGEILLAIHEWEDIVADRLSKLNIVWPLVVDWLQLPSDRLPSVVPIGCDLSETLTRELGFSSGYRIIERVVQGNNEHVEKVLPIPIHQDVSISWVENILDYLIDYRAGGEKL